MRECGKQIRKTICGEDGLKKTHGEVNMQLNCMKQLHQATAWPA